MIRHPGEQRELSLKWFFIHSLQHTQTAILFSRLFFFFLNRKIQDKCVLQTWLMVVEDDYSRVSQRKPAKQNKKTKKTLMFGKLQLPVWLFLSLFVFSILLVFDFKASRDILELLWCVYRTLNHTPATDGFMWLFRTISLQRKPTDSWSCGCLVAFTLFVWSCLHSDSH